MVSLLVKILVFRECAGENGDEDYKTLPQVVIIIIIISS
jgi:hypothetical protein